MKLLSAEGCEKASGSVHEETTAKATEGTDADDGSTTMPLVVHHHAGEGVAHLDPLFRCLGIMT